MNTSVAKANASKSTRQVHVGSCLAVLGVSDGSAQHGDKGTSEFTKRLVTQQGDGRAGSFPGTYSKPSR